MSAEEEANQHETWMFGYLRLSNVQANKIV